KFESGVVRAPISISADASIRDLIALARDNRFSGFPVMKDGQLAGIVSSRDVRFEPHLEAPVSSIMTPKERLVTVKEGATMDQVKELLHRHRIEKVLVVNDKFDLCGMMTVKDITKAESHPDACKDAFARLRVGASIGVGPDTDDRVKALIDAGVDVLVVDTAHGHSRNVIQRVKLIKQKYPDMQVIGGNIA